jgi:hypothetical protein
MYQTFDALRTAPRLREAPPRPAAGLDPRLALARVRKALTAYLPGMHFPQDDLRAALAEPLPVPADDAERHFLLGWLYWLAGDADAEALFHEAVNAAKALRNNDLLGEAAYWRGRARLLFGRADAVAEYEAVLRSLGGSPRGTAFFVDLLWRAGRVDRAEQVWKSVRGNKKVSGSEEGPLLEARAVLRRGELAAAEKLLTEAAPAGVVAQAERLLLLAWALTAQKHHDRAQETYESAAKLPYPAAALEAWRVALDRRADGQPVDLAEPGPLPPGLAALFRGQQERLAGHAEAAAAALREAAAQPAVSSFARYALAALGLDDAAALLAAQPGLFLAVRCRARSARERFRHREAPPGELLDAAQQAASLADAPPLTDDPLVRLAAAVKARDVAALSRMIAEGDPLTRRNALRAAAEIDEPGLLPGFALHRLLEWASLDWVAADPDLRAFLGRLALRRALREGAEATDLAALLPGEPLLALLGGPAAEGPSLAEAGADVVRLAAAARQLSTWGQDGQAPPDEERARWREAVRSASARARLRGPAQALLLHEAAHRLDADAVVALLADLDAWRSFRPAPPAATLRAVLAVVTARPALPAWRTALPRWLGVWGVAVLGEAGATLAAQAGLAEGALAEPPPGVPAAPWFLHQAGRALGRGDARSALAAVRRAQEASPDLPEAARDALPELERAALSQTVADAARPDGAAAEPASLFAGLIALLGATPGGDAVLSAAAAGDTARTRAALDDLAERADLPPALAHHLALIDTRAAEALEEQGGGAAAEPRWRRAWANWLRFLGGEAPAGADDVLLGHLLGGLRTRLSGLLARGEVDDARRQWELLQALPGLAPPALKDDLAGRVERCRDELATDYLLTMREAMRYGSVPEGWRADYEKGLGHLRRLLSLDRDNVRLLTALVEVCDEWFLDLYNATDPPGLTAQVERFTPFALQLARLVEERPGDLSARAALADFYKFRGFVCRDREQKAALYREALRFNPANENVRDLLAELERP